MTSSVEYRPEFHSNLFDNEEVDSALAQRITVRESVVFDEKANQLDTSRRALSRWLSEWSRAAVARKGVREGDVSFLLTTYDFESIAESGRFLANAPEICAALAVLRPDPVRPLIRLLEGIPVVACRTQEQFKQLKSALDTNTLARIVVREPSSKRPALIHERRHEQRLDALYAELGVLFENEDALDHDSNTGVRIAEVEAQIDELERVEAKATEELFKKTLLQPMDAHAKAKEEMAVILAEYEDTGDKDPSAE